jgi:hypothetical protein
VSGNGEKINELHKYNGTLIVYLTIKSVKQDGLPGADSRLTKVMQNQDNIWKAPQSIIITPQ